GRGLRGPRHARSGPPAGPGPAPGGPAARPGSAPAAGSAPGSARDARHLRLTAGLFARRARAVVGHRAALAAARSPGPCPGPAGDQRRVPVASDRGGDALDLVLPPRLLVGGPAVGGRTPGVRAAMRGYAGRRGWLAQPAEPARLTGVPAGLV